MKKENYILIENLRHELHQYPELSYQETMTKKRLMKFISEHTNLEIHDKGKYFYTVYRTEKEEKCKDAIAFRADFDALPIEDEIDSPWKSRVSGMGHKCGHDGHAASLCGLALELEIFKPERDVYMVFQHAEETGQGAREAIEFLNENPDISEIFAFHNQTGEEKGKILIAEDISNCASKGLSIFMKGEPTHASLPEKGKNPVFALAKIVSTIPKFIDPSLNKGLVLCTIVQFSAGAYSFGTAASEGVLRMTLRAQYEDEINRLQNNIMDISEKEAEKYGLQVDFKFEDNFPETRNHPLSVQKVYSAANKIGYKIEEKLMSRGSEDFGYYTKIVPGAIFYIGGGVNTPSFHTSKYDFTDSIMENAVEMFKAIIEI